MHFFILDFLGSWLAVKAHSVLFYCATRRWTRLRDFVSFFTRKKENFGFASSLLVKSICLLFYFILFLSTHLSDDSDESYRSVQRFFRSESAESSSAIDWLELEGFSTIWLTAAVIGIIEISFSWSAPFVCFDVVCIRWDIFSNFSYVHDAHTHKTADPARDETG